MSSAYEIEAQQYQRFSTQRGSQSPTRQAAVKFLMTSPENPFGQEEDEDGYQLNTYQRRHTIAGQNVRSNALAASPESGVKVNMYSQLQEEIKKDMRRRTDFALGGENQFQFLIGCRSDSPTKNYDFAENAISSQSMVNIGANSPERDARQIKKISPYDCFRSGEARQTIVQSKKEVEREMQQSHQSRGGATASTHHQRSSVQQYQPELTASQRQRNSMQPIAPYRKYRPAAEPRMKHAVPHQEPDPDIPRTPPRRNLQRLDTATFGGPVSKSAVKPHRLPQQVSFGATGSSGLIHQQSSESKDSQPRRPTTLGQQMVDKYTAKKNNSQTINNSPFKSQQVLWPSSNKSARQPHHTTAMFRTLNAQNPDDQKQLLDFYSQKYKLKDLSMVQPQTYSRSQVNAGMRMEELKMVNPEVVKRFNLGSVEQIIEMNQVQHSGGMAVGQPLLGQQLTRQQLEKANKIHNAALVVQRHIRGQLIRKKAYQNMQAYLFFRRVHRIVNIRSLIFSMRNAFVNVRNTKQRYLKKYIYFSAAKIQSLVRGHLERKIKIPIKKKIKDKQAIIEAVALGWQTRRIMKLKEVQNRVQQIHDYENAEVETLEEAKKSQTMGDEREKLMSLIDGFRQSRSTTVLKLIKLIHSLSQKGLWLTYVTTEQQEESLRTPRKSAPESFLKRGSRTTGLKDSKNDPFLKVTPSPARNLDFQSNRQDGLRHSFTGVRGSFATQSNQERRVTTQPAQTARGRNVQNGMTQRKFTISHNNMVQPNFHAQSYQEEARNAFKKRMQYNPMEASKKRLNVNPRTLQSEYSQHRKADTAMDVNQVMKQVQERIAENMRQHRARPQTQMNKSADFTPLVPQQPITHLFQKQKYHHPDPAPSESSRPDTPPFEGDGRSRKQTPTHVKISELTSSVKAENRKYETQLSIKSNGTLGMRNSSPLSNSQTPASNHTKNQSIGALATNIPAAGLPTNNSPYSKPKSPERPSYVGKQPLAADLPANISAQKPHAPERPSYLSNTTSTTGQPTSNNPRSALKPRAPQPPAYLSNNVTQASVRPTSNSSAQKSYQVAPERPSYLSNASSAARLPTEDLVEDQQKPQKAHERPSYLSNAPSVAAAGLPSRSGPTTAQKPRAPEPPAYLSQANAKESLTKPIYHHYSDTKSSLFGTISAAEPSTTIATAPLFEKSSKDFKQTPAKFSRQKSDSPDQVVSHEGSREKRNKDLEIDDYPKFQFSSKPASPPQKVVPNIPAKEIKSFMKPAAETSQVGTAASSAQKKASQKNSQQAAEAGGGGEGSKTPPSVRQVSNKVSESANELLAMLQNRNKGVSSNAPPKPKKSAEPKTPGESRKKKKTSTAAGAGGTTASSQKPSIFASAVATRNNAKSKDNASATVYNSQSSAATANFGRAGGAAAQDGATTTGFATNQSVSSSAAMNAAGGMGQAAHKGIKPYQATRRKREERKRGAPTDELDIDKNISMFSSTAKAKAATNDVQPQPYTAMTTTSTSTTKRRISTTSGLFRKVGK